MEMNKKKFFSHLITLCLGIFVGKLFFSSETGLENKLLSGRRGVVTSDYTKKKTDQHTLLTNNSPEKNIKNKSLTNQKIAAEPKKVKRKFYSADNKVEKSREIVNRALGVDHNPSEWGPNEVLIDLYEEALSLDPSNIVALKQYRARDYHQLACDEGQSYFCKRLEQI
jgi:hypothetical protein